MGRQHKKLEKYRKPKVPVKPKEEEDDFEWTASYIFLRWLYLTFVVCYSITTLILIIQFLHILTNLNEETLQKKDF
uniref:SPTSB palmitoyltransferase n=1 Tax=Caenorhabditis tropicalis TaxID=1561998 RepID=A0A1I7UPM8_9PELO